MPTSIIDKQSVLSLSFQYTTFTHALQRNTEKQRETIWGITSSYKHTDWDATAHD